MPRRGILGLFDSSCVLLLLGVFLVQGLLLADKQIRSLREFYEFQLDTTYNQGETHCGGYAWWFGQGSNIGATEAVLLSSLGEGGATLAQLQGGFCYWNVIRAAERGAAIAAMNGWGYEVYLTVLVGGNDYSTVAATFSTDLTAMQSALETAIKSIFSANGWTAPSHVPWFCTQPQAWTDPNFELLTSPAMYVFPALFRSNPNQFVCVGPQYYTDLFVANNEHKTAPGYKLDGEYAARAVMRYRASDAALGLYATGVSNSGTTLTITTSAQSTLAIDTSVVTDPGQYGLYCYDQTASAVVALSGIAVSGTSITTTMASKTTGHVYLVGIADRGTIGNWPGPTTGVRACVRDSSTDTSSSDTNSTPMYNYLVSDELTFTAV